MKMDHSLQFRETISCHICKDFLNEPTTLPCGHSFCLCCIETRWADVVGEKCPGCPRCELTFAVKPNLVKSTTLAVLVEELKTGLQAAPEDHIYAGPEDVACDVCPGRKRKATKSCLQCLASYCDKDLQVHLEAPAFKKHKLTEPSTELQEMLSSPDQEPTCYLCTVEEPGGSDATSAERAEKERELEASRCLVQQRIKDRQRDMRLLRQEMEAIRRSADEAVEHNEKTLSELIQLLEKRRSDVTKQIRCQQETEMKRVKDLQEELELEISELKSRDLDLEELSNTEDHVQFLENYQSLSPLRKASDSSSIRNRPLRYFRDATAAVSELRDKLHDDLSEKWTNILETVAAVDVLLTEPEPKTREDFLRYARVLTWDPNSVCKKLVLAQGLKKVTLLDEEQSYPEHPERFKSWAQVLSKESLTGRCYWEVEWNRLGVYVAVAYKDGCREEGDPGIFGINDKSWALECKEEEYNYWHNIVSIPITGPWSSKVGVYLDHSAGVLAFYSISRKKEMTLLHRVHTRFTQPLHAGVHLRFMSPGLSAKFCKLK